MMLPQQIDVMLCMLPPLLQDIDCVLLWTNSGAKTRRVLRARGAGVDYAMHHCLVANWDLRLDNKVARDCKR